MISCENQEILEPKILKSPEEVEDGYSSIKELFSKMSQITQLQAEPNYPYKFKSEDYPTYIIIGDIHGGEGEYKIREMLGLIKQKLGCKYLIDTDGEGPEKEINAVKILKEKFGIYIVGLENEFYKEDFFSKIGKGVSNIEGVDVVGIESLDKIEKQASVEAFPLLVYRRNIAKAIGDENIVSSIKPSDIKPSDNFGDFTNTIDIGDALEQSPSEEDLKKIYGIILKLLEILLHGSYSEDIILGLEKFVEDLFNQEGIDIWGLDNKGIKDLYKKYSMHYLQERSKHGISTMDLFISSLKEKRKDIPVNTPRVMIYGKGHIPGLLDLLNKKYKGEVNIYVAK